MDKAVEIINLVVKVVIRFWKITWLRRLVWETIGTVWGARDMDKSKVEGENDDNLAINAYTGFKTWIH